MSLLWRVRCVRGLSLLACAGSHVAPHDPADAVPPELPTGYGEARQERVSFAVAVLEQRMSLAAEVSGGARSAKP